METFGIKKFNSSGVPQPFSDPSLGGATAIPTPGNFGEFFDLSVDAAGTIFFANGWDGKIHKYAKSGAEAGSPFPIGDLTTSPRGIAVRPDGDFWVSQDVFEKNKVILYHADGTESETAIPLEEAGPLALDGQGNLYAVYNVKAAAMAAPGRREIRRRRALPLSGGSGTGQRHRGGSVDRRSVRQSRFSSAAKTSPSTTRPVRRSTNSARPNHR